MSNVRDVVIVGSGPAGYTAAIYAARAGLNPLLVAGWFPGGALINTTEVENFPGFPDGIDGPELMENMLEQCKKFGTEVLYEDVESIALAGELKVITLFEGKEILTKTVILAMGAQHRHLNVPGEEEFGGRGVSYCATCDASFFKGQKVAVVGGGDSAVEEATYIAKFASEVVLIHRRNELRASKAMQNRIGKTDNLSVMWNTHVTEVLGENKMTGLRLSTAQNGEFIESTMDLAGLFIAIGHDPRSDMVKDFVSVDEGGYVMTANGTTEVIASAPSVEVVSGVFACGDLVDSRYRQAITAAGSGCAAALDVNRYLESLEE